MIIDFKDGVLNYGIFVKFNDSVFASVTMFFKVESVCEDLLRMQEDE